MFGASPTIPEDLLNGPHADQPGDEPIIDDKHAKEVALRTAARAAYFHVQTDERVRRALAGRARVEARAPEVGERVFYYRKTKNNKKGIWVGPGTVIGQEGVNVWVTRGGRCVLCAPEHVRLATGEELGQAFNLQVAQQDLDKLLNADSEDEEMFAAAEAGDRDEDEGGEDEDDGGGAGEIAFDMEDGEPDRRGVRRDLLRVPPRVAKATKKERKRRRRGRSFRATPGTYVEKGANSSFPREATGERNPMDFDPGGDAPSIPKCRSSPVEGARRHWGTRSAQPGGQRKSPPDSAGGKDLRIPVCIPG